MIVKYLSEDVWGYIDNVRQTATMGIDCEELITQYDEELEQDIRKDDIACYMKVEQKFETEEGTMVLDSKRLPEDVCASNKTFLLASEMASRNFDAAQYGRCHTENLINGQYAIENHPAYIIVLYLNDHKEYDTLILITNQKCFLMNDKGQTIERLV